jgi:MFS family permease
MNQVQIADRNIKFYVVIRIFAKRVFIPLTAIYFIDTAGFSIREIGYLSAFFSLVQLLAEVPTGYFADRIGRIMSIRVGAILAAIATTTYVFIHHKTGIYLGVMLESLGYSFLGGAGEALIHDSLVIKKQEHNYTKFMSRTQSVSLIANAILITIVPMTYAINPSYPFAIGTLAYLLLLITALFMHDVKRATSVVKLKLPMLKDITGKKNLLLFALSFGVIAALYTSPADMFNVALRDYGINVSLIGWIYALGSVVGALIGPVFHHLRKLRLSSYLLIDVASLVSVYLAAFTRQPYVLAIAIICGIAFGAIAA